MSNREKVLIARMKFDAGTQFRQTMDKDAIADYAEKKKAGVKFPDVDVFFDGHDYILAHGFHRVSADIMNGETHAWAQVHRGDARKAILFAVGQNDDHGVRRTISDKRLAALALLEDKEWKRLSNGVIAEKTKTSAPFVGKLRQKLREQGQEQPTKTISKRGVAVKTEKIGKKTTEKGPTSKAAAHADVDVKAIAQDDDPLPVPFQLTAPDPAGWNELEIKLNIEIKRGTGNKRRIDLAARAGEGNPVFRNGVFTLKDLQPMPPALQAVFDEVRSSFIDNPKAATKTTKK